MMGIEEYRHSNSTISISRSSTSRNHLGFSTISKACKSFFFKCYPKTNKSNSPSSSLQQQQQNHSKVKNRWSCDDNNVRRRCHAVEDAPRSVVTASVNTTTTILHSNSNGVAKPAAIERPLHCTLEELCFGCVKKINIMRTALSLDNGVITDKDEEFTIKVNPGWRKGTVVTFEGRSEKPGMITADVVFVVSEAEHASFIRRGDDLELEVEIPLIDALTVSTLLVPLLGKETMSMPIDEVVHPGYELIIKGEGMPKLDGRRGNLVIKFLVKFPNDRKTEI